MVLVMAVILGISLYPATGSELNQGKTLYTNKCQMCHGADGKGNGPAAAAFNPKPEDFTKPQFWGKKNVDHLIGETVKTGHGKMPAFDLSSNQINSIIDYMSHTFKP